MELAETDRATSTAGTVAGVRVAIAHEWLVRYAGSERCVEQMLLAFPGARLLTTLLDRARLPDAFQHAEPSWLQKIPGAVQHHELLVPLMPASWRLRPMVAGVDVVVSSSHACAKAIRRPPDVPHLCYCHTPMRYAWSFDDEADRFGRSIRPLARAGMVAFRRWDRSTALGVTQFVANSNAVARRIETCYGRPATVIHPPVDTEFFHPGGERGDDFVYVGRLSGYKRPALVAQAFEGLPYRLTIVGKGELWHRLKTTAPPNVSFTGEVSRRRLRELLRSARALVFPVKEDFGIAMAEAQACGTPVIALREGGAADIVRDGETGWLLETQDVGELRCAIRRAAVEKLDESAIRASALRFSAARFRHEFRDVVTWLNTSSASQLARWAAVAR